MYSGMQISSSIQEAGMTMSGLAARRACSHARTELRCQDTEEGRVTVAPQYDRTWPTGALSYGSNKCHLRLAYGRRLGFERDHRLGPRKFPGLLTTASVGMFFGRRLN